MAVATKVAPVDAAAAVVFGFGRQRREDFGEGKNLAEEGGKGKISQDQFFPPNKTSWYQV